MLQIQFPQARAVFQRNEKNEGIVPIWGNIRFQSIKIYYNLFARYEKLDDPHSVGDWIQISPASTSFQGILKIPAGGWYRIVVQLKNGKKMLSQASVDKIGVGEIILTLGQSNSANSGSVCTTLQSDLG